MGGGQGEPAASGPKVVVINGIRYEVTGRGLMYCPELPEPGAKHPCPDCLGCNWCAESRCQVCRQGEAQAERPPV